MRSRVEEGAEVADHGLELGLEGGLALLELVEPEGQGGVVGDEEVPGQGLLAGVVGVEGPLGDAGGPGDVIDGGLGDPLLDEQAEGGGGDAGPGRRGVAHG